MALTKILNKRSSVAGRIPTPEALEFGEIAINTADGKAFIKTSSDGGATSNVVSIGENFELPVASEALLGGVRIGANLAIDGSGILSAIIPDSNAIFSLSSVSDFDTFSLVYDAGTDHVATLKALRAADGVSITEVNGVIRIGAALDQIALTVNNQTPDETGNIQITAFSTGALPLTGGIMQGPISMASNPLTNLPDPANPQDPVTLNFLNNLVVDNGIYA